MAERKQIQIYLITGFLGAGKTTLLKKLLNIWPDRKKGVLLNEFGKIGIDGITIKEDGLELLEINNGSIFCSCLQSSFTDGLALFSKMPIDILFIEASGLADPSNFEETLEELAARIGTVYEYRGAVCVADPTRFIELLGTAGFVERQIVYSHAVIINKVDLVDSNRLAQVEAEIKRLNPFAKIIKTSFAGLEENPLEEDLRNFEFPNPQGSINVPSDKSDTFVLKAEGDFKKEPFKDFLASFSKDTFRIKGFFRLDGGCYHIDGVGENIVIRPTGFKRTSSELVIIPKPGVSILLRVKRNWREHFQERSFID